MTDLLVTINPPGYEDFASIKTYGTPDTPYFLVVDIEHALGMGRLHIQRDYKLGDDYVKIKIDHGGQSRTLTALTEHGLYHVLYRTMSPVGDRFRKFVTIILRELRLRGVVERDAAIQKLREQLDDASRRGAALEQQMDAEHTKYMVVVKERDQFFNRLTNAQINLLAAQTRENQMNLWNRGSPEYRLQKMREQFYKKLYVYVEPIPRELVGDIQPYDDTPHESDMLLLSVSFTRRTRDELSVVYVPPGTKTSDIEELLAEFAVGTRKNRYHMSVETLSEQLERLEN